VLTSSDSIPALLAKAICPRPPPRGVGEGVNVLVGVGVFVFVGGMVEVGEEVNVGVKEGTTVGDGVGGSAIGGTTVAGDEVAMVIGAGWQLINANRITNR
jgi:hypothetical protein